MVNLKAGAVRILLPIELVVEPISLQPLQRYGSTPAEICVPVGSALVVILGEEELVEVEHGAVVLLLACLQEFGVLVQYVVGEILGTSDAGEGLVCGCQQPRHDVVVIIEEFIELLSVPVDLVEALIVSCLHSHHWSGHGVIDVDLVAEEQLIVLCRVEARLEQVNDVLSIIGVDGRFVADQPGKFSLLGVCQRVVCRSKQAPMNLHSSLNWLDCDLRIALFNLVESGPHCLKICLPICNVPDVSDHSVSRVVRSVDPEDLSIECLALAGASRRDKVANVLLPACLRDPLLVVAKEFSINDIAAAPAEPEQLAEAELVRCIEGAVCDGRKRH